MDSFLTLSNPFKQFQSFNQIIPAASFKPATLNSYKKYYNPFYFVFACTSRSPGFGAGAFSNKRPMELLLQLSLKKWPTYSLTNPYF